MNERPIGLWRGILWVAAVLALSALAKDAATGGEAKDGKAAGPSIAITNAPPEDVKPGPDSKGAIAGKVSGVEVAQHRVVVYAFGDQWYVQPTAASPYTAISKDGSWKAETHGGFEYAALLVRSSYKPPSTLSALPEVGGDIVAIARCRAGGKPSTSGPRTITFCGFVWRVKPSHGKVGPGPNYFSDGGENVWLDAEGRLHVKITHRDGEWQCSEVISKQSFGYGTYRFHLDSPVDNLDPHIVLGLFTWSDEKAYAHREIDIECSRWGRDKDETNAQFVVQPYERPGRLVRFQIPSGLTASLHEFTWDSKSVVFRSLKGNDPAAKEAGALIKEWTFSGTAVPQAGGENARINLWLMNGRPPKNGKEQEVIIRKFEFIKLGTETP